MGRSRRTIVSGVLFLAGLAWHAGTVAGAEPMPAAEKIEALGGKIKRDAAVPGRPVIEVDLAGHPFGTTTLGLLAAFPELQSLDISATRAGDEGFLRLKTLKRLKTIRARGCAIGDGGLAVLESLGEVRTLDLAGTRITDAGLAHVSACVKLQELNLTGTLVSDAGLKSLAKLPDLRVLRLFATKVRGPGLADLVHLRTLDLRATDVDDKGLAALENLKEMEELDLSRTLVSGEGLRHLQEMKSLHSLRIAGIILPWTRGGPLKLDAQHLSALTSLRQLDLTLSVCGQGCAAFGKLTNLERLVLDDCGLTRNCYPATIEEDEFGEQHKNDPPEFLRPLTKLKDLRLSHTDIGDAWLEVIGDLPELVNLDLSSTEVTDDGLKNLSRLTRLERLNLSKINERSGSLAMIGTLQRLRDLMLNGGSVNDAGMHQLSLLPELRRVELRDTEVGSRYADDSLARLRQQCPKLAIIRQRLAVDCKSFWPSPELQVAASLDDLCDHLSIVQGEVRQVARSTFGDEAVRGSIEITHVYSGPADLLGKTFSAWSQRWWDVGTKAEDYQTNDGYFEVGEPGIWFVRQESSKTYYSLWSPVELTCPYRPAPREWPVPADDFFAGRRMAEEFRPIFLATAADRLPLLEKAAIEGSPLMSEFAVELLARAAKPVAIEQLRRLANTVAVPMRGQIALDKSLAKLEGDGWYGSNDRNELVLRWAHSRLDETLAKWAAWRVEASISEAKGALDDNLPTISAFVLSDSIPISVREGIPHYLVWKYQHGQAASGPLRALLIKLGEQKDDPRIHRSVVYSILGTLSLDAEWKQWLTKLAEVEQDETLRKAIEKSLANRVDSKASDR
jgi:Leucine-rich repeat (LRR) protein